MTEDRVVVQCAFADHLTRKQRCNNGLVDDPQPSENVYSRYEDVEEGDEGASFPEVVINDKDVEGDGKDAEKDARDASDEVGL